MLTESSNIQNTDVIAGRLERNASVDLRHDVIEQPTVQRLGQRVTSVIGLVDFQWNPNIKPIINKTNIIL